jgi:hypothetical protein
MGRKCGGQIPANYAARTVAYFRRVGIVAPAFLFDGLVFCASSGLLELG